MRTFVDTNVLVYALGGQDPRKQARALEVLEGLRRDGQGVISTQVLQGLANTALRKLGLPALLVREALLALDWLDVKPVQRAFVHDALEIVGTVGLSFWDALIVATAEASRCRRLLTEDMSAGQRIRGLTIVNPFA
jgi:predicted nucleic acid-binding protein